MATTGGSSSTVVGAISKVAGKASKFSPNPIAFILGSVLGVISGPINRYNNAEKEDNAKENRRNNPD